MPTSYWIDYGWSDSWAERKKKRTAYFMKNFYKNKLVTCPACSGSGYYDNHGSPKCGSCGGTGKVRER